MKDVNVCGVIYVKKRIKKVIIGVLLVSFLLLLGHNGYDLLKTNQNKREKEKIYQNYDVIKKVVTDNNTNEEVVSGTVEKTGDEALNKAQKLVTLSDLRGIIEVSGTNINSFIMQGSDNSFYLNHLENGEYNELGSIMLDYRNNLENDTISVIYGHNAYASYTPFEELEKFYQKGFYEKNKYIYITSGGVRHKYEIFTVAMVPKKTSRHIQIEFESEQKLDEHLHWLREISLYDTGVEVNTSDKVLILQTCSIKYDGNFLIIGGRKVI